MKRKAKMLISAIVAVMTVGFAGLNILAYNHARAMMRFTPSGDRTRKPEALSAWQKTRVLLSGVTVPRPSGQRSPADLATDCREVKICAPQGITLDAWYCDRGPSTPLVILFHGYASEKTALLQETRMFLDLGTSVLLVDFRGSGGSSEAYTTVGIHESDDVAALVQFAQRDLSHSRFILFGQSMGAVAILGAIRNHGIQPDAVILEAVFDTLLNTVRNRFRAMRVPSFPSAELLVFWGGQQWDFNGFNHNPVDYATSVDCPALFMHGRDDPRATLDEGRRVFNAVPGPREFKIFDRTGHESYVSTNPAEWRTSVDAFIKKTNNLAKVDRHSQL